MFREYKPAVPKGPAGSEVTLFAELIAQAYRRDAREALAIAALLQGDASPRMSIPTDAEDAVALVNLSSNCERAYGHHVLQQSAATPISSLSGLAKGLVLYLQKDARAYAALRCVPTIVGLWPVRLLLREHFLLRCHAVRLGTDDVAPVRALFTCRTRLAEYSMDHPSTVPRPKPAGAVDIKELSEQKHRHRAIRAATLPSRLRGGWSIDEFVRTRRARALYEKATGPSASAAAVSAITAAVALEPDNLFLKAARISLRCQSGV
jgi:hypothetical protein